MAFSVDIVELAKANAFLREVISTGPNAHVVVMSIPPGGEIGEESAVGPDRLVHVPARTLHNFKNTGPGDLRLYAVYAPPQHARGTIDKTKADANADQADHFVPA